MQPRELFSIFETKHDDVLLLRKASDQTDFGPYHADLKEQRFSIHPSPLSNGITITQRLTFANGLKADTYAHIKPFMGHLNWPVIAWACQSLDHVKYISEPKNSDKSISLGSYDPRFCVPCYLIFVSQKQEEMDRVFSPFPLNVHKLEFRAFNLWILTGFINTPSTHLGCGSTFSTFPPRLGGENLIDPGAGRGWDYAMRRDQIAPYVRFALEGLSACIERKVLAWLETQEGEQPDNIPIDRAGIAMTCRLFSKSPLYQPS